MKKPIAIVVSKKPEERKRIADLLKNGVSKEIGIDFKVNQYENRKRKGEGGQLYIATSLNPNSSQQELARTIRDEEPHCARILVTSSRDLINQDMEHTNQSLLSNYLAHKKTAEPPINWEDVREWFRREYPAFHDIVIERDNHSLEAGVKSAIDYIRKGRKMCQPLSVGIAGLGKLGLGILEEAAGKGYISHTQVFTNFVGGNYELLLKILEPGVRDKITSGDLDELFDADPDVLVISTGKHDIDYRQYGTRSELTKMLLETSIPKVRPIIKKSLERKFSGLIAMQTNPNSQLITYARDLGIASDQLTSFPPDTNRHIAELYKKIKELHPETKIRREDLNLIAVGDHMNGGIPLYSECTVNGLKSRAIHLFEAFPEFQDKKLQEEVCKKARGIGLGVMQSAERYEHDYRGVPELVREYLRDMAYFQRDASHPIYYGILGVPVEFTYQGKGDTVNIRVQKAKNIADLTKDEEVRREISEEIKDIHEATKPYLEPKN